MNAPLRAALLSGRRRPVVRGGARPYPRRGDGFEVAELRGYVEGDDPRRIDWAATARAGALHVRVLLDERAMCFGAIVDASLSMRVGRSRGLRAAAYDALDLWADALAVEDRAVRIGDDAVAAPQPAARSGGCAAARAARTRRLRPERRVAAGACGPASRRGAARRERFLRRPG